MRGGVIAHGGGTARAIDAGGDLVADRELTCFDLNVMTEHIGQHFGGVVDLREEGAVVAFAQLPCVADLTARFSVKRCLVEDDEAALTRGDAVHSDAVDVDASHFRAVDGEVVVAFKIGFRAIVADGGVHFELASGARSILLGVHGGGETRFINAETALAAHVRGQVERKTKGVVQFKRHVTRQSTASGQGCEFGVQNFHAVGDGFKETFFFGEQGLRDDCFFCREVGVGCAHFGHQVFDQFREKRFAHAEFVTMTNRAADDAAQHIATAFVRWNHAIDDEE